jgi:hypothetical protein
LTTRTLVLLAIAALLAGCVGADRADPVAPAADRNDAHAAPGDGGGNAPPPSSPPAEPSPASGEPATEDATGEPGAADEPAPTFRVIPIGWDGRTAPTLCLPSGPNSCMGPAVPFVGDDFQATGVSGVVSGALTLTWDAQTPAHENLQLQAWSATSCGDSCWEGTGTLSVFVSGASPLALEFPETLLETGETIVLSVRAARLPAPDPVVAYAAGEQAFHLEGALRVAT